MDRIYDAHGNMSKEESDYLGDKAYEMMEAYLLENGWEKSWAEDNWVRSDAKNKEANTGIGTVMAYEIARGTYPSKRLYTYKDI